MGIEEHNQALLRMKSKFEQELPDLLQKVQSIIRDTNKIHLLADLSLQEMFLQADMDESFHHVLKDHSGLPFLIGLCLKESNVGEKILLPNELEDVLQILDKYFNAFCWLAGELDLSKRTPADSVIFLSRLKKMMDEINHHSYPFQKDDHVLGVFTKLDDYFIQKYGFKVSEALEFGKKIPTRVDALIKKRLEFIKTKVKEAEQTLNDPNTGSYLLERYRQNNVDPKRMITAYGNFLLFSNGVEILVFEVDSFCKEENITNQSSFKNYLNALSCRFGDHKDYENPLSDNLILHKPLIALDGSNFFCPKPDYCHYNLPDILESLLLDEKNKKSTVWKKFEKLRGKYLEDKTYEFFSRIFPQDRLFRNLFYFHNGKRIELDLLILYDNKIFIVESKSGNLSKAAQRGGRKSLEKDFKKIMEDAYEQASEVKNYIEASNEVVFYDEKNQPVVRFKRKLDFNYFMINVTLENLGGISTQIYELADLGLFTQNDYPWSVSLYDLDVVTNIINSPTILIHYLEQTLSAQKKGVFGTFSELQYLGYYLKSGNFYIPQTDDPENVAHVSLTVDWMDGIENHYLHNGPKPKLNIEPEIMQMIRNFEKHEQEYHTRLSCTLLDLPHNYRRKLTKAIKEKIISAKKTRKPDGFSLFFQELGIGFSFLAHSKRVLLPKMILVTSEARKYQYRADRWVGMARDLNDGRNMVTFFLRLSEPWQENDEQKKLLKQYLKQSNI